jgi:DnaJ-class molecular chaperone with C-terminal Zn finger domain
MEFKDYYQILGVEKNASADEIKKAYRKLARKYHPDVSKETDAAQRMAEINEANTVLSDAEKRKAYDQLGAQAYAQGMGAGGHYQPPPNWDSDFSFSEGAGDFSGFRGGEEEGYSEFFEHLFGRAAHTRRARGASASGAASMRGEDQRATIELDLADLYQGAERHRSRCRATRWMPRGILFRSSVPCTSNSQGCT